LEKKGGMVKKRVKKRQRGEVRYYTKKSVGPFREL
jgi:hypothetical protein